MNKKSIKLKRKINKMLALYRSVDTPGGRIYFRDETGYFAMIKSVRVDKDGDVILEG